MPLPNRVDPSGAIEAVAARGTVMGNRGRLHDAERRLVRTSEVRRWIYCELEFRGRRREVMSPRSYTELFFLDVPTALAAGHRPCAECRHAEYVRFGQCWAAVHGADVRPYADEIDTALAPWRRSGARGPRRHDAAPGDLPDGAIISWRDAPWLVAGERVHRWAFGGYTASEPRDVLPDPVSVLTPPPTVAVLAAGFSYAPPAPYSVSKRRRDAW